MTWERSVLKRPDQVRYACGQYVIYTGISEGKAVLSSGAPDFIGPYHTDTVEGAMSIAEKHASLKGV
jgi:hypothetical protein